MKLKEVRVYLCWFRSKLLEWSVLLVWFCSKPQLRLNDPKIKNCHLKIASCSLLWLCLNEYKVRSDCIHDPTFRHSSLLSSTVFPDPPLLTPDEGPSASLETSIFPLPFQVVREYHYPRWQR